MISLFRFNVVKGPHREYTGLCVRLWAKNQKEAIGRFQNMMGLDALFVVSECHSAHA